MAEGREECGEMRGYGRKGAGKMREMEGERARGKYKEWAGMGRENMGGGAQEIWAQGHKRIRFEADSFAMDYFLYEFACGVRCTGFVGAARGAQASWARRARLYSIGR